MLAISAADAVVSVVIAAIAASGALYMARRGVLSDRAMAKVTDEANTDTHSIALIKSAQEVQTAALASALEQIRYLRDRVEHLTAERVVDRQKIGKLETEIERLESEIRELRLAQ